MNSGFHADEIKNLKIPNKEQHHADARRIQAAPYQSRARVHQVGIK